MRVNPRLPVVRLRVDTEQGVCTMALHYAETHADASTDGTGVPLAISARHYQKLHELYAVTSSGWWLHTLGWGRMRSL